RGRAVLLPDDRAGERRAGVPEHVPADRPVDQIGGSEVKGSEDSPMDLNTLIQNTTAILVAVAWKVVGALALWLIGRWRIGFALGLIGRAAAKQQFDVTLTRYLQTALKIVLNVALIVAILGFFGVERTTFAALLAAGGVAIGVAWGGLLSNFAAG